MEISPQLPRVFLALSFVCAVAVVVLFNVAGAGLLMRWLLYSLLIGLLSSAVATVLSLRPHAQRALRQVSVIVLAIYVLATTALIWVLASAPTLS